MTAAAVLALALGIGANTAIFSIINNVLLRPLPFRDPDRLVAIWEKDESRQRDRSFVSPANSNDWKSQKQLFEEVCVIHTLPVNLSGGLGEHTEPEELQAERISTGLFAMLGVQPALGRAFRPEEGEPGHNDVVLIGYDLWKRRYAGDPNILGKTVRISGPLPKSSDLSWRVIGVMPPDFHLLNRDTQIWIPILPNLDTSGGSRTRRYLAVVARLRPGVTVQRARAEMEILGRRLAQTYPNEDAGWNITLLPLHDEIVGDVRPALMVLLTAVCFLLLMACVNTANLLLARAVSRQREMAVRIALGAGRGRLARQLITESVVLALMGGVLGLTTAFAGVRLLAAFAPKEIPRLEHVAIDAPLLIFTLLVSFVTGVFFGLAPVAELALSNLTTTLKEAGRGSSSGRMRARLRGALVISEVALAMLLLVGAGLMIRSYIRLQGVDLGLNPQRVLTMRVLITGSRNSPEPQRIQFFQQVVERISTLPGVVSAGAVSFLPLAGFGSGTFFSVEGRPAALASEKQIALIRAVVPGYFRAMGIPLIKGRLLTPRDDRAATRVVMVNQTLARRFWSSEDQALGKRLILEFRQPVTVEIVGVVKDVKAEGPKSETWSTIYATHPQFPSPNMVLVARTAGDPLRMAQTVAREVYALDPDQPVAEVRSMEQVAAESVANSRFQTFLLAVFASVALLLAAVGIYGVMAYSVTERTHEIGVRMAVGASPGGILRQVVGRGAILAGIGIAAGLGFAFGVTRLMSTMLFGVPPTDPATFFGLALLLGLVAVMACWLPARKASHVEPIDALRHE